ncbi:MAG: hypothetical protein ACM3UO_00470 [Bacillota bacterium]
MTLTKDPTTETGDLTGTADKDYNLLWFTTTCLKNALRLEQYASDAERSGDQDVANLLRRAQENSVRGAEEGKALLHTRVCSPS